MFKIRKAVAEDFELVFPLFQDFGNDLVSREDWKRIFVLPWPTSEDFCGYLLLEDEKPRGFLGGVFSERAIDGKSEKFCNMTSWIVDERCRGQSILLLVELLKLKGYTFTNFTASPTVAAILLKFGFQEFPLDQRVLLPIPRMSSKIKSRCDLNPEVVESRLAGNELKIFQDHRELDCHHLLLSSNHEDSYVVVQRTSRKRLPFGKVHYLSDVETFHHVLESQILKICVRLRICGLMIDERYVRGRQFKGSVEYPHQRKGYFKSNSIVDETRIDTIYSELVLLSI